MCVHVNLKCVRFQLVVPLKAALVGVSQGLSEESTDLYFLPYSISSVVYYVCKIRGFISAVMILIITNIHMKFAVKA